MKIKYPCPCCGFKTFTEPVEGSFNICPVCAWEDDETQILDPNFSGGANKFSLLDARENFKQLGASDPALKSKCRKPNADE